jgi:hypothetical protein
MFALMVAVFIVPTPLTSSSLALLGVALCWPDSHVMSWHWLRGPLRACGISIASASLSHLDSLNQPLHSFLRLLVLVPQSVLASFKHAIWIFPRPREPIWARLSQRPTTVELQPSCTKPSSLHHSGFRLWPSQVFVVLRPLFQATSTRHGPCSSNNEPASLAIGNPTNRSDMPSGQRRVKRQNAIQTIGFSLSMRSQRHSMSSCLA